MAQQKQIRLGTMSLQVRSLSGLRIRRCHELWCRSQMQLGSAVAMARPIPAATTPIRSLAQEPPYTASAALKGQKTKKKEKKKKNQKIHQNYLNISKITSHAQIQ